MTPLMIPLLQNRSSASSGQARGHVNKFQNMTSVSKALILEDFISEVSHPMLGDVVNDGQEAFNDDDNDLTSIEDNHIVADVENADDQVDVTTVTSDVEISDPSM